MAAFLALPPEVLQHVLTAVNPQDLATLPRCCRALHTFISGNRQLFKELYLQRLDEPPECLNGAEPDWEEGLHKLVRLQKILAHERDEKKALSTVAWICDSVSDITERRMQFRFVAQTVADLLRTAAPRQLPSLNVALLSRLSQDERSQNFLFCNSELFQRSRGVNCKGHFIERQLSAKLHCLYGVPIEATGRTRSSQTYPYACSKVYDLRNYTQNTLWGPYLNDGSLFVDWEKVEAIMVIIGHNLRMFSERTGDSIYKSIWSKLYKSIWTKPFAAAVPDSYTSLSALRIDDATPPLDAQDPFNVTGTYMRVVCFLDFTELFAYNFASERPANGGPRPPLDTIEAIRIILMEVRITKTEEPGVDDSQLFPVVHFSGTSRSVHQPWEPNAVSNIRGTVRLTREGEVRWTTISIFQGEERWRSEGIQVGGIRSARGVLGHWFDKDYDAHGPAGPTAFWKISDEVDVEQEDLIDMIPI